MCSGVANGWPGPGATVKHYAFYSGPECDHHCPEFEVNGTFVTRGNFNAVVDAQDAAQSYLPMFAAARQQAPSLPLGGCPGFLGKFDTSWDSRKRVVFFGARSHLKEVHWIVHGLDCSKKSPRGFPKKELGRSQRGCDSLPPSPLSHLRARQTAAIRIIRLRPPLSGVCGSADSGVTVGKWGRGTMDPKTKSPPHRLCLCLPCLAPGRGAARRGRRRGRVGDELLLARQWPLHGRQCALPAHRTAGGVRLRRRPRGHGLVPATRSRPTGS